MPFQWREHTKKFKWQTDDLSGLPVATIERIGAGVYVMACPMCGCSHNLLANQPTTGIYAPLCTNGIHQGLWKIERALWIRRFPDAANHNVIMLRAVEAVESPDQDATPDSPAEAIETVLEVVKQRRQRRKQAA